MIPAFKFALQDLGPTVALAAVGLNGVQVQHAGVVESVTFKSSITEKSVAQVITLIKATKPSTLRITSWGGDEYFAAKLAYEINSRRMTVIADNYCVSACVNVLLSSASATVNRNTFVALHPSSYSVYKWVNSGHNVSPLTDAIRSDSERPYEAIRAVGYSPDKLNFINSAFFNSYPRCADIITANGVSRARVYYERPLWIPSQQALEKAGVQVPSDWPQSLREALSFAEKYLKRDTGIVFGDVADSKRSPKFPVLTECP